MKRPMQKLALVIVAAVTLGFVVMIQSQPSDAANPQITQQHSDLQAAVVALALPTIKHVTVSGVHIDAATFEIHVECSEVYQVKAVYAVAVDPDNDLLIAYQQVFAVGDFGSEGFARDWEIGHASFNPSQDSLEGQEVLSRFQVPLPVTIPANGFLRVTGTVEATTDETDDVLNVGAMVETAQRADCTVDVF